MKFQFGTLLATQHAVCTFEPSFLSTCLRRHLQGDWGNLPPEDKEANDRGLLIGDRLLSAYSDEKGNHLWIITEQDRSATTLLLPEDY